MEKQDEREDQESGEGDKTTIATTGTTPAAPTATRDAQVAVSAAHTGVRHEREQASGAACSMGGRTDKCRHTRLDRQRRRMYIRDMRSAQLLAHDAPAAQHRIDYKGCSLTPLVVR